jgi:copper transport protein
VTALVVAAVAVLAVVGTPSRAEAHAELVATEPAAGEHFDVAPDRVVLRFTEAVDVAEDSVEVFAGSGDAVGVGEARHPPADRARVEVELPSLDDGAYVVAWRVVSTDSHPVRGAFTFRVGDAGTAEDAEALMDELLAGSGGDRWLGAVYGVARFAAFAGIVVMVGGAAFVLALWPAGTGDRRTRRLLRSGWWVALLATAAAIGLQGAYGAGLSLGDALDPSVVGDELGARAGRVWTVRLALLVALAVLGAVVGRRPSPAQVGAAGDDDPSTPSGSWPMVVAGVLGLGVLATISAAGHAGSGDLVALALVVDVTHLAAVSVWLGGLALLVAVLFRPAGEPQAEGEPEAGTAGVRLAEVVGRFSSVALVAVGVIVGTGVVQGWRQVRGVEALTSTTYGRLLLVKVSLVAVTVATAAISRNWVRTRLRPPAADGSVRIAGLRRSVVAETALAVLVLTVTALLVNAPPGRTAVGGGTFSARVHGSAGYVDVTIDPVEVGPTRIDLRTAHHDGAPLEPEELTATLTLPERDLGPLDVIVDQTGPGRFVATGSELPFPGDWQIEVVVRTSDIDQERLAVPFTVP